MEHYEAGPLSLSQPFDSLPFVYIPEFFPKVHFTIYLLRHPKVGSRWEGVCYGDSDVDLEPDWEATFDSKLSYLQQLSEQDRIREVWHSDLSRTREPASWLASRLAVDCKGDVRLRERHFGSWQDIAWSNIPQEQVMDAHEMLDNPSTYRPGNGETTSEVIHRVTQWLQENLMACEANESSRLQAAMVAHSGSITSLCGSMLGLHPREWTPFYLKPSEWLILSNHNISNCAIDLT